MSGEFHGQKSLAGYSPGGAKSGTQLNSDESREFFSKGEVMEYRKEFFKFKSAIPNLKNINRKVGSVY